jgi:hypothetical protein
MVLAAPATASPPLPGVSVPTATVPPVTVPTASVPTITAGPVTTPQVTTPSVSTPQLITPSVSTPSLPVQVPPISTPALGSGSHSPSNGGTSSSSAGSRDTTPQASPATSGAASGAPSVSQTSASAVRSSGRGGKLVARRASPTGHRAAAGHPRRAGTGATATTAGVTAGGAVSAAGGRTQTGTASGQPASSSTPSSKPGPFRRLVNNLPSAVLFALLAFGVIAAAMTLNAYLQGRRARSLAGQREALLSDVGVLQAALLPAVPETLGELDVTVAYRPAQGLAAGGDFFDVFTMSPERTGIIIGDVSGHGRESLIHAALVRYTLRTLMGEGHPLPEVLARADRYLSGELGDGFATVIVCCYEHTTAELRWAKAGHEPPIIAGEPDRDEKAATPLGFGLGDTWPEFSRFLAPGERVCLFTDGLTEARRDGEQLGRAHLHSLVDEGLSAQGLVERIQSDSDECNDDLAAVVITRAMLVGPVDAVDADLDTSDTRSPATI